MKKRLGLERSMQLIPGSVHQSPFEAHIEALQAPIEAVVSERIYHQVGYKYSNNLRREEGTNKKYMEYFMKFHPIVMDSIVNALKVDFQFQNIRIKSKDDEIRKCDCETEFSIKNEKMGLTKNLSEI